MDVDPDAPVLWLQPTPEGYQVPAGQGLLAPVRCEAEQWEGGVWKEAEFGVGWREAESVCGGVGGFCQL